MKTRFDSKKLDEDESEEVDVSADDPRLFYQWQRDFRLKSKTRRGRVN